MNVRQFDILAREHFGRALRPHGFFSKGSKHCTFYRQPNSDVYHLIMPSRISQNGSYQIHVFPTSPLFQPDFSERFPDDVWFPTGPNTYLNDAGAIGQTQTTFSCRSIDAFSESFERRVQPALTSTALPFLNRFETIEDMIPVLADEMALGIALYRCGHLAKARAILRREIAKLEKRGVDGVRYREHIRSIAGV